METQADGIYFGDFWGSRAQGIFRCALFQLGGLSASVRDAKEHELFNIIRQHKINAAFLQELGLNWYALGDSQQWHKQVAEELDSNETKTRCCHNTRAGIL